MRLFHLYRRGEIWYARLNDPTTGKRGTGKSTGERDKEKALFVCQKWVYETGVPTGRSKVPRSPATHFEVENLLKLLREIPFNEQADIPRILDVLRNRGYIEGARLKNEVRETFIAFLYRFWDYENSPYIKDRKAHGKTSGKTHCDNNTSSIKNYWEPYFNDKLLCELTRQDLKDFSLWLADQKKVKRKDKEIIKTDDPLSVSTRNNILKVATVSLRWAYLERMISENPADGLSFFAGKGAKRGILTREEAEKLFTAGQWGGNPANKLGSFTAMQTGARLGELCALRLKNLHPDRISISKSWSHTEGEKNTKTNEVRDVAITPELYTTLLNHAKTNPHGCGPESFIFYHMEKADRPHDGKMMYRSLKKALVSIGIDEDERKARNILFHSWRHFFARYLVDVLDKRAADLTGHATPEVLAAYADHAMTADWKKAQEAVSQVFGKIVFFDKEAAV